MHNMIIYHLGVLLHGIILSVIDIVKNYILSKTSNG